MSYVCKRSKLIVYLSYFIESWQNGQSPTSNPIRKCKVLYLKQMFSPHTRYLLLIVKLINIITQMTFFLAFLSWLSNLNKNVKNYYNTNLHCHVCVLCTTIYYYNSLFILQVRCCTCTYSTDDERRDDPYTDHRVLQGLPNSK